MDLFSHNRQKVSELQAFSQEPCLQWVGECFRKHLPFRIIEAFRSQKRQNDLWNIGRRGIPGELPVTWTKNSIHTKRLALDALPLATDGMPMTPPRVRILLSEIAELGKKYAIVRPPATLSVGDYVHFETHLAHAYQPELTEEEQKILEAAQVAKQTGTFRDRAIRRYVKRWAEQPPI